MPRNGSGVYSLPTGTDDFVPNTTIESSKMDALTADLEADANAARPVVAGGTGAATAVGGADNLSTADSIASGTTTNLATVTGVVVTVTGTDTITAFGTVQAGGIRTLIFADALTLTHNASSLILPTGANITTAAGDIAVMLSLGSGNWRCIGYTKADGTALSVVSVVGQQTIFVPAGAMTPTDTNGAAAATEELATNDVMLNHLDFDDSTRENACFQIQMPKSWDEGTLICQFVWKCGATSGDVIWGIQAVAFADDDALDTAFGTAVEVTDTAGGAADDCMISDETGALTVAGSPGAEEFVVFKVYRDAADGSDTLSGDAELLGLKIHYTTNAGTDA